MGPLTMAEVEQNKHGPTDYGIYQIYSTHVSGADQLVYVGCTTETSGGKFGVRVPSHRDNWADWEPKAGRDLPGSVRERSTNTRDPTGDGGMGTMDKLGAIHTHLLHQPAVQ